MAKTFTKEELKKYNGLGGNPAYVACKGKVYNVSESPVWEIGDHFGHGAGKDLTEELEEAPHEEEVFRDFEVVGELIKD